MKKLIKYSIGFILFVGVLYLHSNYVIKHVNKEHDRLHGLIKDSVKMHQYFERTYSGEYLKFEPVTINCEK